MASTYLTRTPSSDSNRTKWTFSAWIKKSSPSASSAESMILSAGTYNTNQMLQLANQEDFTFRHYNANGSLSWGLTTAKTRDPSAWYHLVVTFDTAQATSTNRVKIYLNGSLATLTGNYPDQNQDSVINSTLAQNIGFRSGSSYYFNGLMTHIHLCDGYAYAASDFGETDTTSGIWKPKTAPSVSYGTNGFFLKFENSGAMGTDSSGQGNNFTVSGTITQNIDTPSNNFATLNPLKQNNTATTYSNGNLKGTGTSSTSNFSSTPATLAASSGKFYAEYKPNLSTTDSSISGFVNLDTANFNVTDFYGGNNNASAGLYDNAGQILHSTGTNLGSVGALSNGDIVMLAMDLDNGYLYWGKNGTWFNSANPATSGGTGGLALSNIGSNGTYTFLNGNRKSMGTEWNFGSGYFGTTAVSSAGSAPSGGGIFEYDCPSGYQALCTKGINSF